MFFQIIQGYRRDQEGGLSPVKSADRRREQGRFDQRLNDNKEWAPGKWNRSEERHAGVCDGWPLQQDPRPLYSHDGGHCMTFRDFDGNPWLSFHHPDRNPAERPHFLPLAEDKLLPPPETPPGALRIPNKTPLSAAGAVLLGAPELNTPSQAGNESAGGDR